ncbi:MAG: leucyl aminopeptidase family protein [Pacificimonas sp.]
MTDLSKCLDSAPNEDARKIIPVTEEDFEAWREALSPRAAAAVKASRFAGAAGSFAIVPGTEADDWYIATGIGGEDGDLWSLAHLPRKLPPGRYRYGGDLPNGSALGWTLAQYRFDRYRPSEDTEPRTLVLETKAEVDNLLMQAEAQALVRDLVTTPAEDMGPAELEAAIRTEAADRSATVETFTGEALLSENYPAIHAVGRAAAPGREPRLVRLDWQGSGANSTSKRLVLVGKGVCFDSGGLDVKSAAGMRLMKKDMGGAAHSIALARMVMAADIPVRLTLLVAAVENAVSANALRPGDVISTRAGKSVEIHNTDAEGRLVICDALALAEELEPDLVLDFATLTGAARVALGPDLPVMFANDDALAAAWLAAGEAEQDPVWRLPLWAPYDRMLASDIADFSNAAASGFAGAITAALYLKKFVGDGTSWAHLDTFSWMPSSKPGRPKGGEALGLRSAFAMIRARYTTD